MSESTLLLRCEGPMQSWGTRSRFGQRDTGLEPSKSGVVGLLACALGRARHEDLSDLAGLVMAVRVDRPGHVESDYQTIGGGTFRGRSYGVSKASGASPATALSTRSYLADASFLVALRGPTGLLEEGAAALMSPTWPLFLGRKGYVPAVPPGIPDGLVSEPLLDSLRGHIWPRNRHGDLEPRLRVVVECGPDEPGDRRRDVPLSFDSANRAYGFRRVRDIWLEAPEH